MLGYSIHPSAKKHGARDRDIVHAIDHVLVIAEIDEDKLLHIGPDVSGNLLEVIERDGLVFHAMPMRPQYSILLRGSGEPHA